MTATTMKDNDLFDGLKALAKSAFPKKCSTCGRVFQNAEDFIRATEYVRPSVSGLKQSTDDDGLAIVELFRNCPCGSTLMDAFNNSRDMSEQGEKRRKRFSELMEYLNNNHDMDTETARTALLKVMRGEKSEVLANINPTGK